MRVLLALFLIFKIISIQTFAQESISPDNLHRPELSQQGNLVSVQIVPGNPIKIFVVGREEAKFDLSDFKLVVWRLSENGRKKLDVEKEGKYFTVNPTYFRSPQDLEVNAIVKGKEEKFKFKIDNNLR